MKYLDVKKAKRVIKALRNSKRNNRDDAANATGDAMAAAGLENATGIPSVTKIAKLKAANMATFRTDKRARTIDAIKTAMDNAENYPSL